MSAAHTCVPLLLVLLTGCGGSEPSCPISGQVYVNDRPAEGVYLLFHSSSQERSLPASTRTDKNGTYSLHVRAPGEYAVAVFWPKRTDDAGGTVEGEDLFRGRYRDPRHPVQKVPIGVGENALPPLRLRLK